MAFCTQCGSEMGDGAVFCTSCGARTGCGDGSAAAQPAVEQAVEAEGRLAAEKESNGVPAAKDSPIEVAPLPTTERGAAGEGRCLDAATEPQARGPQSASSRKTLAVAAATAALGAVVACLLVFSSNEAGPNGDAGMPAAGNPEAVATLDEVVLGETYITKMPQVQAITYPNMAFDYPVDWELVEQTLSGSEEVAAVESPTGSARVAFDAGFNQAAPARAPFVAYVEKLASSSFEPAYVQASDHRAMGSFMVAKVGVEMSVGTSGQHVVSDYYAVLPESALANPDSIDLSLGAPAFDYSRMTQFCSPVPEGGFSPEDEAAVIAILSSFRIASTEEAMDVGVDPLAQDYILPESATRLYSSSELADLSDYELFVARNEIFARHGREFQKEELRQHFGSKPWYRPTISPGDFKDSMLSSTEKKNVEAIKAIEESRSSPYLLP